MLETKVMSYTNEGGVADDLRLIGQQIEPWGLVFEFKNSQTYRKMFLIEEDLGGTKAIVITDKDNHLRAFATSIPVQGKTPETFLIQVTTSKKEAADPMIPAMINSEFIRRLPEVDHEFLKNWKNDFGGMPDAEVTMQSKRGASVVERNPIVFEPPPVERRAKVADMFCIRGLWMDSVSSCVFKHLCKFGKCFDNDPTDPGCNVDLQKAKACLGLSE